DPFLGKPDDVCSPHVEIDASGKDCDDNTESPEEAQPSTALVARAKGPCRRVRAALGASCRIIGRRRPFLAPVVNEPAAVRTRQSVRVVADDLPTLNTSLVGDSGHFF